MFILQLLVFITISLLLPSTMSIGNVIGIELLIAVYGLLNYIQGTKTQKE
jgi:hypothetical protein